MLTPDNYAQQPALTLQELHTKLGELLAEMPERADLRVEIPFARGTPSIGGRNATPVVAVQVGFDWDRGKLFLKPNQALGIVGAELTELAQRARSQANLIFHLNEMAKKALPSESASDLANRIQVMVAGHPGGIKLPAVQPFANGLASAQTKG